MEESQTFDARHQHWNINVGLNKQYVSTKQVAEYIERRIAPTVRADRNVTPAAAMAHICVGLAFAKSMGQEIKSFMMAAEELINDLQPSTKESDV